MPVETKKGNLAQALKIMLHLTHRIMKKHALALFVLCITAACTKAQEMKAGIKGGLNIADVSSMDGDNRLSGHVGLFLHGSLSRNWGIQPELLYSGQGQRYTFLNRDYTLALNYLQVPLMFQYFPTRQFYLEFGPYVGFLLSARIKSDGDHTEVDDSYRKVEAGLGLGAGIWATRQLGFYARYNIGLSDITKDDNHDYYNRVGQIGMAIKFK
jgi:hypothetical protein